MWDISGAGSSLLVKERLQACFWFLVFCFELGTKEGQILTPMVHWNFLAILMESSEAGDQATAEEHLRPTGFLAGFVSGVGCLGRGP
jgi:hypothetical protein